MDDRELEMLVDDMADQWGGGMEVGTMYGDFALDVAKAVRDIMRLDKLIDSCWKRDKDE